MDGVFGAQLSNFLGGSSKKTLGGSWMVNQLAAGYGIFLKNWKPQPKFPAWSRSNVWAVHVALQQNHLWADFAPSRCLWNELEHINFAWLPSLYVGLRSDDSSIHIFMIKCYPGDWHFMIQKFEKKHTCYRIVLNSWFKNYSNLPR